MLEALARDANASRVLSRVSQLLIEIHALDKRGASRRAQPVNFPRN